MASQKELFSYTQATSLLLDLHRL